MDLMNQKQVDNTIDENYKKIREQGVKVFVGTSEPTIVEGWLQNM